MVLVNLIQIVQILMSVQISCIFKEHSSVYIWLYPMSVGSPKLCINSVYLVIKVHEFILCASSKFGII